MGIDSRLKPEFSTLRLMHVYEVRPRKDHRGTDLIRGAICLDSRSKQSLHPKLDHVCAGTIAATALNYRTQFF
jgi:hypothetical protein